GARAGPGARARRAARAVPGAGGAGGASAGSRSKRSARGGGRRSSRRRSRGGLRPPALVARPAGRIVKSVSEELSPTLRAVSDAVLSVAAERSVEEVLQRLVEGARELVGARYAALGTPAGDGGFSRFLTAGMSDELVAALGPLPRTHGMLGAMLETADSFRTPDIHGDPRFRGWWPKGHPDMRS